MSLSIDDGLMLAESCFLWCKAIGITNSITQQAHSPIRLRFMPALLWGCCHIPCQPHTIPPQTAAHTYTCVIYCQCCLMGRNTYESIPEAKRPLKDCLHIVVTRVTKTITSCAATAGLASGVCLDRSRQAHQAGGTLQHGPQGH